MYHEKLLNMLCVISLPQDNAKTGAQVMLFQPIALEQQAKDLLKEGQYEQALALANVCAVHGAPWVETAFAQAALLLLNGVLLPAV